MTSPKLGRHQQYVRDNTGRRVMSELGCLWLILVPLIAVAAVFTLA